MFKNIGSSWLLLLLTVGATYLIMPFSIKVLGEGAYGTFLLITSTTNYLSLLMMGVPMATVRHLAKLSAEGKPEEVNRAIGSCLVLFLGMSVTSLLAGGLLYLFFDQTYALSGALRQEARLAFALTVLWASAGFVGQLLNAILAAHRDFVVRSAILTASLLLRLGLTFGLLSLKPSIVWLAAVQVIVLVFEGVTMWAVIQRRHPGTRISLRDFDRGLIRQIFSFSVFVLVLQLGIKLSFQTDSLVIGKVLGVQQIPFYAVANSLIFYLMEFVIAVGDVMMPTVTTLHTRGELGELRAVYLKWSKITLSLSLLVGLFLIVFGPQFIGWWIGPSYVKPAGEVLQVLMISGLIFLPARGIALPILMGIGQPKVPTLLFLLAGVLNLVLSLALVRPLGLFGNALGTAIPNVLFALAMMWMACRALELPLWEYVSYVVPRAALGSLPVLALLLWLKWELTWPSLPTLFVAGSSMTILFGVIWVFFVYRNDRYMDLPGLLDSLRLGRRGGTA